MGFNKKDLEIINDNLYPLDLNYLKIICDKYDIDYNVYIESNGDIKKLGTINHKEFIINDIMYYLKNNKIPKKTIYKQKIQNYTTTNNLKSSDYIFYGQYKTTDKNILNLLKSLTNNEFKFGGISQKLIKLIWKKNKLITYEKFAKLWYAEFKKGTGHYREWAYNQCIKNNGDITKWKKIKNNSISIIKKYNIL